MLIWGRSLAISYPLTEDSAAPKGGGRVDCHKKEREALIATALYGDRYSSGYSEQPCDRGVVRVPFLSWLGSDGRPGCAPVCGGVDIRKPHIVHAGIKPLLINTWA